MTTYQQFDLDEVDFDSDPTSLRVTIDAPSGLGMTINVAGYGEKCADDGYGTPIYLELYQGKLVLRVWADINSEEPTHVIDMSGALESRRQPESW